MSLPYSSLKEYSNRQYGKGCHFFFKNWYPITMVADISIYRYVLDTTTMNAYSHPMVCEGNLTRPASCFFLKNVAVSFETVFQVIQNRKYIHANTIDGSYLICSNEYSFANAYKTLVRDSIAFASRPVESSDRQIHWVWFRKPNYRLTEEIILRAASWIELNPGYQFHLWSSMKDKDECDDFLKDIPVDLFDKYFLSGVITVHYIKEFYETVFSWLKEHTPALVDIFQQVWDSKERQDTVMKTDYTRNIILAVHGGIYADFNDLLCLDPIEPLLEAHAGRYVGVTDNTSQNNASNYFMYASKGSSEWQDICVRCMNTLPNVRDTIYSNDALCVAIQSIKDMVHEQLPDLDKIQGVLNCGFNGTYKPKHFIFAIGFALKTALIDTGLGKSLNALLFKSAHGRMGPTFLSDVATIIRNSNEVLSLVQSPLFAPIWRFARTDMYLSSIMHRTNLPIFCRQQNIPIFLVPFGYLIRYGCGLSFVGHLGDATSYGMDPQKKVTMRELMGIH